PRPPSAAHSPYTTLFRSREDVLELPVGDDTARVRERPFAGIVEPVEARREPDALGDGVQRVREQLVVGGAHRGLGACHFDVEHEDRKSTRLNSSHVKISY